jgi:hypothetical protein
MRHPFVGKYLNPLNLILEFFFITVDRFWVDAVGTLLEFDSRFKIVLQPY